VAEAADSTAAAQAEAQQTTELVPKVEADAGPCRREWTGERATLSAREAPVEPVRVRMSPRRPLRDLAGTRAEGAHPSEVGR